MNIVNILNKVLRWENAEYNVEFSTLFRYCENQKCMVSNLRNDLIQALKTMRAKQEIQDFCIADSHIVILK